MTPDDVRAWLNNYTHAWRSPGVALLSDLFTPDVTYQVSPFKAPLQGLEAVSTFWEQARSGPNESFDIKYEIIAIDGSTAVVQLEVHYQHDEPHHWRDLWIIKFKQGRCHAFAEWPFASDQADGQTI